MLTSTLSVLEEMSHQPSEQTRSFLLSLSGFSHTVLLLPPLSPGLYVQLSSRLQLLAIAALGVPFSPHENEFLAFEFEFHPPSTILSFGGSWSHIAAASGRGAGQTLHRMQAHCRANV